MLTFTGPIPYFLCRRTLRTVASSPFSDEILSANRQLIGILGVALPLKDTSRLASSAPDGKFLAIKGFDSIPVSRRRLASSGTEYGSEPTDPMFSIWEVKTTRF